MFNVNGVSGRLPVLTRWLAETEPQIVFLQELKAPDEPWCCYGVIRANNGGAGPRRRRGPLWCRLQAAIILSRWKRIRTAHCCFLPADPDLRDQAGSMVSTDHHCSAVLTRTRSSNHPLICKIRSRSTPAYSHTQSRCVARSMAHTKMTRRYGLREARVRAQAPV
jgi:hypothetical protein